MKMVKSLILGSAAGLVVLGGAQAADLPVKAKAVEYVKICSLYGAGFYYIPGTDTCIKLSGYLRADVVANENSDAAYANASLAGTRYGNSFTWRSREDLDVDTRTATEYGVVRTFFDATFNWTTDAYAGAGTGASVYGAGAPGNGSSGNVALGGVGVYYAFIQFAGFTIGKAISQFSAPWTNYPGNNFDGLVGGGGTVTGVNQFSYTADFGAGLSGTISFEDPTQYYQAGVLNQGTGTGALGAFGSSDYGGTVAPDIVGMFRVDQAWGLFQASIAAHDNNPAYYGATSLTGHPDDVWGYAGALALSIKNIPTGPGDTINIQGVYTKGATRYNIQDLAGGIGAAVMFGGNSKVAFGTAPDTVFGLGTSQQLIQTWGFRGAYTHNWTPKVFTSVYGAYAGVNYNGTAQALVCANFVATYGAGVTTCNPNYSIGQVGTITGFTPLKNLTFSADLTYTQLYQKMGGTALIPANAATGKPGGVYTLANGNALQLLLRAQRNF